MCYTSSVCILFASLQNENASRDNTDSQGNKPEDSSKEKDKTENDRITDYHGLNHYKIDPQTRCSTQPTPKRDEHHMWEEVHHHNTQY